MLEKSTGPGGRMATRQVGGAIFDHGAQYFTARNQAFRKIVAEWEGQGIVRQWAESFPRPGNRPQDGFPKYCGVGGMSAICRHLAEPLDIIFERTVIDVSPENTSWLVSTEQGDSYQTDRLIITSPMPQTLSLLKTTTIKLPAYVRMGLTMIAYDPCITVLAVLDGPSKIPEPGGIELGGEPVFWMADSRMKGICDSGYGVTIHAGPNFSQQVWNQPDEEISTRLLDETEEWLGRIPVSCHLHRWHYSRTTATYPEPYLLIREPATLILCGDGFWDARIEGAALSGLAAAEAATRE